MTSQFSFLFCFGVDFSSFCLQVSNEPGNRYNIQLINALVLYVGTQAIAHIHNKGSTPSMSTITHSAHMDIFQNLAVDLDTEGKRAVDHLSPGVALQQVL